MLSLARCRRFTLASALLFACSDPEEGADAPVGRGDAEIKDATSSAPADASVQDASSTGAEGPRVVFTQREYQLAAEIEGPNPVYYFTCSDEGLQKRVGDVWSPLLDERPVTPPYTLDGEVVSNVDLGCDVLDCVPLERLTLSRNEYVRELSPYPAPAGVTDRFSTRLASLPLRLTLTYYVDERCAGEAQTLSAETGPWAAPSTPALATTIRVRNASSGTRSRIASCHGAPAVYVGPRDHTSTYNPLCIPTGCSSIASDVTLEPDRLCGSVPCVGTRVDIAPGASDEPFVYDGGALSYTDRNCVESIGLERGTPMLATVCFGTPGTESVAVRDTACTTYPFLYGDESLDIVLD